MQPSSILKLSTTPARSADLIIAAVVANGLALALPILLLQVFTRVVPQEGGQTLAMLALGAAVAIVLEQVVRTADAMLRTTAEVAAPFGSAHAAVAAWLGAAAPTPLGASAAEARLTELRALRAARQPTRSSMSTDAGFALLFVGFLAVLSPVLAAAAVTSVLVGAVAAALFRRRAARLATEVDAADGLRRSLQLEVLQNIETIKALNAEPLMMRRHDRLLGTASARRGRAAALSHMQRGMGSVLAHLTTVTVGVTGAVMVMAGELHVGALAAGILLSGRAAEPLLRSLAAAEPGAPTRAPAAVDAAPAESERIDPGLFVCLAVEGVRPLAAVAPEASTAPVTFSVEVGEAVAITGATGVGKSMLLWQIANGLVPGGGALRFNGSPCERVPQARLVAEIAYLEQEPRLIPGTILENLTRFDPQRYEPEAIELARELRLDRAFAELPLGYATRVTTVWPPELPASVIARIATVRALVGDKRLILFDEANAALSLAEDERLVRLLRRLAPRAALVLVSDRPSYWALADRLYEWTPDQFARRAHVPVFGGG